MNKEHERLSAHFTLKAQKLFILTYEKFREVTKKLDRQKDENVFQLQLAKFIATLKLQLGQIAHEILTKNNSTQNTREINEVLKHRINIYLTEFRQKAKLL